MFLRCDQVLDSQAPRRRFRNWIGSSTRPILSLRSRQALSLRSGWQAKKAPLNMASNGGLHLQRTALVVLTNAFRCVELPAAAGRFRKRGVVGQFPVSRLLGQVDCDLRFPRTGLLGSQPFALVR